jgi:Ca2+-binding EF-hand superfamily protein
MGLDPMIAHKMKKASQVFRIYDKDMSGSLNYKEWKKAMKALGYLLPKGQKQQLFYMIDKDRSGQIDEREFCKYHYGLVLSLCGLIALTR